MLMISSLCNAIIRLVVIMIVIVTVYLIINTAINIARSKSGCPEKLSQNDIVSWRPFPASTVVSDFLIESS